MNNRELRVGNYVSNLMGENIIATWENIKWSQDVAPIPLTEKWLKTFGFKDNSYRDYFLYHPIADYAIISISFRYNKTQLSDITSISVDDHDLNLKCEYVHQLQNLYFSLTGEELTITPPH